MGPWVTVTLVSKDVSGTRNAGCHGPKKGELEAPASRSMGVTRKINLIMSSGSSRFSSRTELLPMSHWHRFPGFQFPGFRKLKNHRKPPETWKLFCQFADGLGVVH